MWKSGENLLCSSQRVRVNHTLHPAELAEEVGTRAKKRNTAYLEKYRATRQAHRKAPERTKGVF